MRKWLILGAVASILLTGCGSSGEENASNVPVELPTAAVQLAPDGTPAPGDSPRGGSVGLPPTFTPDAQEVISGAPTSAARPSTSTSGPVITDDTRTYTVVRGDTLGEIATEYGVELDDLIQINRLTIDDIDRIYPGQVLVIPDS